MPSGLVEEFESDLRVRRTATDGQFITAVSETEPIEPLRARIERAGRDDNSLVRFRERRRVLQLVNGRLPAIAARVIHVEPINHCPLFATRGRRRDRYQCRRRERHGSRRWQRNGRRDWKRCRRRDRDRHSTRRRDRHGRWRGEWYRRRDRGRRSTWHWNHTAHVRRVLARDACTANGACAAERGAATP